MPCVDILCRWDFRGVWWKYHCQAWLDVFVDGHGRGTHICSHGWFYICWLMVWGVQISNYWKVQRCLLPGVINQKKNCWIFKSCQHKGLYQIWERLSLERGCRFESQQENFLLQSQLCVLTLIRCLFHPLVNAVAYKRPQSFWQKCRWQVTPKHIYTLDPTKSEWADYTVQV